MILCSMILEASIFPAMPPAITIRLRRPLLLTIIIIVISACDNSSDTIHLRGQTMGTSYSIKFHAGQQTPKAKAVQALVERKLEELDQALSTYREDSELSQINRSVEHQTFTLGPLLQKALRLSFQVFEQSGGLFDPSVGPLVNLWGHGPQRHQNPPGQQEINRTLPLVGLGKYHISKDFKQLRKPHRDSYLDFSASGKGLGVDEVALVLESLGIQQYMVEIGGEIKVRSHDNSNKNRSSKVWQLAIERPQNQTGDATNASIQTVIPMANGHLATSGNYRNYYKKGNKRYGHTINPHNGKSVANNLLSASVIHDESCALADAWATAFMAMGHPRAQTVANRLKIKAFFVIATSDGPRELSSAHWPQSTSGEAL